MKSSIWLAACLLTGCADFYSVDPSKVLVVMDPTFTGCGSLDGLVRGIVQIRNDSRAVLVMNVYNEESPYKISWLSYDVLNEKGEKDWDLSGGGHGPMTGGTIHIHAGDSEKLAVDIYMPLPSAYNLPIKIRLKDHNGATFTTAAFYPCLAPKATRGA